MKTKIFDKRIKKPFQPTWAEVDLKAIRYNFKEISRIAGRQTAILSVVKANAYGHGMIEVAHLLQREGADLLGVADLDEGIILRNHGIKKPILIFENVFPLYAKEVIDYDLTPTVCTLPLANALNRYAKKKGRKIGIHIKIDTGMGRLGVWYEEALQFIKTIGRLPMIAIEGVYTHFPAADSDKHFTRSQIGHFLELMEQLKKFDIVIPYRHVANSMGLVDYRMDVFNLIRPGLMLYGLYPSPTLRSKIELKPALSVKSKIIFLKTVAKGRSISYGRTFIAKKDMNIATLPIGYNDGYFRCFSNSARVLVNGIFCPLVGRVTMDQVMVDVSRVKSAKIGIPVVLLGTQKKKTIFADDLASLADTINYEITCSLGNRLPRVYKR
ncbi:MAG TPA: alanine racemase [Candidatus Omnitrophota bacterium]|nr:alanine racemase [Candidatus Omnitrophota bacterium]HPD84800.1 alanine racemase [Candidatus Omnitrophota bacterium]HRZ03658.1 alanine racemase [Candidatus Omnitrophota bacterium]